MPKCFFFDIDGTLVNAVNSVPESAWQAIETLRGNGHYCFLCSGRNLPSAMSFDCPEMDGIIYCSGGGIYFNHKNLASYEMPAEVLNAVYDLLKETGSSYILYSEQIGFANPPQIRMFEEFGKKIGLSGAEMRRIYALQEDDTYQGEAILKIDAHVPNEKVEEFLDCLDPVLKFVPTEYGTTPEDGVYGEISMKEVSKGTAARFILSRLGIGVKDSYAFGDSMNDHALLTACGTGIAMANGSANLKKDADLVAPDVNEDGIARALQQLGLI
ncbi:MAG: HAD family hydrolase [Erysipelotrichaceae bacterium]|nr:HAD family hydrolase [Erysipelotrichaceae bacterium]